MFVSQGYDMRIAQFSKYDIRDRVRYSTEERVVDVVFPAMMRRMDVRMQQQPNILQNSDAHEDRQGVPPPMGRIMHEPACRANSKACCHVDVV